MTLTLSATVLNSLPDNVGQPGYNRSKLSAGIMHFGVGNFHRAHQAVYLDELFSMGIGHEWGILGAGVFDFEIPGYHDLKEQDFLFSVVDQSAQVSKARIVGSLVDYIKPADTAKIIKALADPKIRIVSLTITEGGYFIDANSDKFNSFAPSIIADSKLPNNPMTVFGLIIAGLKARRADGVEPFTIMSCDNIPHNGGVTRNAVCGLAGLFDREMAGWIDANVAFPDSMVDRITPATGDRESHKVIKEFDIEDKSPVFCEDFTQWVLEDNFPSGRPPLEKVGVQFVADVGPFEVMKIRILNGGHAVIAYPGGLLDIEYVHEAMEHPLISAFLHKVELDEILPIVPPVPKIDLNQYLATITERFANPKIGDTIRRLCLDGSNRQPKFIIPSINDRLAKNLSFEGLALESALWCRYCFGFSESGTIIEPNDPSWDVLKSTAEKAKIDPSIWISQRNIYGSLVDNGAFVKSFTFWLDNLWAEGTVKTLESYLK